MSTSTQWFHNHHEAVSSNGMVAAKHPLASEAGLNVLKNGGNAIDAAITTALTMGVVEPFMNGVGGGGFMVYYSAKTGKVYVLDYFMHAPRRATPDMYEIVEAGNVNVLGFGGVKNDENAVGPRSVGVPGLIAGAETALARFGTISLSQALEPAIHYAKNGFEANWHHMLQTGQAMDLLMRYPETAKIFLREGKYLHRAPSAGTTDRVMQSDLGDTLARVANEGAKGFYEGEVAQKIVQYLSANGNPMGLDDLANYQPTWLEPRSVSYKDYTLHYAPSTGGGTLAETFNLLEGFDWAGLTANDPTALHWFIESARIAYADRWAHLGDERTITVPHHLLESKDYAHKRRAEIQPDKATKSVSAWAGSMTGAPEDAGGCTTHLSVIDKDRNMVAITQTINAVYGSGVVVPSTGILCNNTMVLFDPMPGRKNSISGGKFPLSSMTPTIVLKNNKPFMTVGAPGGRQIMGAVMRVIHNVVEFGMGIQAACSNISIDASADKTVIDSSLGQATLDALAARGHALDVRPTNIFPRIFASPTGILINPRTGQLHGGADAMHPGQVMGY
jgi:gamma-glutamyltranspeptidase/glutathione hydrolase